MSGKKEKKSINLVGNGVKSRKKIAKAKSRRRGPEPRKEQKSRKRARSRR
jgi:hypothetical protein